MATNASDNLDEFFDFARLEHDHGSRLSTGLGHDPSKPITLPDDVMVMDWATDATTTICPTDTFLPHDVHMQVSYEETPISKIAQQWPLVDVPHQSSSLARDESVTTLAIPTWHMCGPADVQDPIHYQEPRSFPPSSSYHAREQLEPTIEDDDEGLKGVLSLPQEPTTTQLDHSKPGNHGSQASEPSAVPPRDRPAAPLRQASIASWKPASAKRKGPQSRIPLEARQILEDEFTANPYPCSWEMDIIAHQANLDVKKVRNWFNNTRARKKGGGRFRLANIGYASCLRIQTLNSPSKR